MTHTVKCLLTLAVLTAALFTQPLAAQAADDGQQVVEKRVEVQTVDVEGVTGEDGQPHKRVRVVVASPDGDGEQRRFVWRGETEDGGDHIVWRNEDGQVIELPSGDGPNVFFSPGVERGFLGVELTDLTPELRRHFGAADDRGVLIGRVVEGSPAERAGLRVGDVLTHIDGEAVSGNLDVTRRIGARGAGEVAALEVLRDGKVETVSATLEVRERPQVELRKLLHRSGDLPHVFQFDTEGLDDTMAEVRAYFQSPEWQGEMEKMSQDLQQRMKVLEIQLEGLEEELDIELDDIDVDVDLDPETDPDPK